MRGLILFCGLAVAVPALPATGADPVPSPNGGLTDRDGVAGGATAKAQEGDARQDYARSVEQSLDKWDHRIAELKHVSQGLPSRRARNATAILEEMKHQAHADLSELQQVRGKAWLDVKGRIDARLRRMDKEYRYVYAE